MNLIIEWQVFEPTGWSIAIGFVATKRHKKPQKHEDFLEEYGYRFN